MCPVRDKNGKKWRKAMFRIPTSNDIMIKH